MCQAVLNLDEKRDQLSHILTLLWSVLIGPKSHIYQLYPGVILSCTVWVGGCVSEIKTDDIKLNMDLMQNYIYNNIIYVG